MSIILQTAREPLIPSPMLRGATLPPAPPVPYCGEPPLPAEIWTSWNVDPLLIAALAAAAVLHARHAALDGPQRGARLACFTAGWSLLAILFVSPFCALASALFAAREAHHMLLAAVIAPLLVLAAPRQSGRMTGPGWPVALAVLHAGVLWFWHAPATYAAALDHAGVYWVMQLSLLGSALALWRALLAPSAALAPGLAGLGFTVLQTALLGALLTFMREPLYAYHTVTSWLWGLSPLEDQQLAGALMWALGAAPYLAALLALLATRLLKGSPDLSTT